MMRLLPHLGLFIMMLFLFGLFTSTLQNWTQSKAHESELKKLIANSEELLKRSSLLTKEKAILANAYSVSHNRLRPFTESSDFSGFVTSLIQQNGVALVSLIPSPPVKEKDLIRTCMVLTAKGSYKDIIRFLDSLEKSRYIVQIEKIAIFRERKEGWVRLELSLSVFWVGSE